jgi:hypothetical protein
MNQNMYELSKIKTNSNLFSIIILVRIQYIMRNMHKMKMKKSGMLGMLAAMAGKQALSYLAPKVAGWVANKVKGKKGKGVRPGGGSLRPLGGAGIRPVGGALRLSGSKGKYGNGVMSKLISQQKQ